MKKKLTAKQNELIAKFMEYECDHENTAGVCYLIGYQWVKPEYMKFCYDWNLLMQVRDKINSTMYYSYQVEVMIYRYGAIIYTKNPDDTAHSEAIKAIANTAHINHDHPDPNDPEHVPLIYAVADAFVTFIEWYNQNKI